MKKLTIAISEEAHSELLKIQLAKRLEKKKKTSLAEIAAEVLHNCVVEKEKPGQ
jgi:phosphoribosylformylglycinamidine (FGAM) synthase PurS component